MNHQEPQEYTPEQLGIIRRQAEELLENAAERVLGPPRREAAPTQVFLDWENPALDNPSLITFVLRVERRGQTSSVRFQIDLHRLLVTEQERLGDFLGRRLAGITDAYDLSWHLSWMLDRWLTQEQPELPPQERRAAVRRLLLY